MFKKLLFTLIITTSLIYDSKAQSAKSFYKQYLYAYQLYNAEDDNAIKEFKKAISLYNTSMGNTYVEEFLNSLYMVGDEYYRFEDYKKAIEYYSKCLKELKSVKFENTLLQFDANLAIGQAYSNLFFYRTASRYFEYCEEILHKIEDSKLHSLFYNEVGIIYDGIGDYELSLKYLKKAQLIDVKNGGNSLAASINIGRCYQQLGRFTKSLEVFNNINISEVPLPDNSLALLVIKYLKGQAYLELGKHRECLEILKKSSSEIVNNKSLPVNLEISIYNLLGEVNLTLKNYALAEKYLSKAENSIEKGFNSVNEYVLRCFILKSKWKRAVGEPLKALSYCQESLKKISPSFQLEGDTLFSLKETSFVSQFLELLDEMGQAYQELYAVDGNQKHLKNAWKSFHLAVLLSEENRKTFQSSASKLFFTEKVYPIFVNAVKAGYALYKAEKKESLREVIVQVIEKSKASVLQDVLWEDKIKSFGTVPDTLVAKEREVEKNIALLKTQKNKHEGDKEKLRLIVSRIRDLEIELQNIKESFEKYPQYYQLKYSNQNIDMTKAMTYCKRKDLAILSYFDTPDAIYAYSIVRDKYELYKIDKDSLFDKSLGYVKEQLYLHPDERHYKFEEDPWVTTLYQHLIQPVYEVISKHKKLLIIPDINFQDIPFEILRPVKEEYLLYKNSITYNYSLKKTLEENNAKRKMGNIEVLAIAPFANYRIDFTKKERLYYPLKQTDKEVSSLKGTILINEKATKEAFLENVSYHNILHLATHTHVNDSDPDKSYIVFRPDTTDYKLYSTELYALNLSNTDLAILSACQTDKGKKIKGEGALSLARGFSYAGCNNLILTRWYAEDISTSFIIKRFYHHLEKGLGKDEALQKAKIDFLESENLVYEADKNILNWANLVFYGNPSPLYKKPPHTYFWWIVLAGSIVVIFVIVYLRTRRNGSNQF